MTLFEKINSATSSVELIGYCEDSKALTNADQESALAAISARLEWLGRHARRAFTAAEKPKSIKRLFGRHAQTSDVTNPDYGDPISPCALTPKERKR